MRCPREIRPIKSEADCQAALKEIEPLMSAENSTPEGDRLDKLTTLVEAYEREHYPIERSANAGRSIDSA